MTGNGTAGLTFGIYPGSAAGDDHGQIVAGPADDPRRVIKALDELQGHDGRPFLVRYCRVGVLNDVGDLLSPSVVVLLIGERPGLATAESLSAYMAFHPRSGHTDADRNLISNIHSRGVGIEVAAARILNLASRMMAKQLSGTRIREELPSTVAERLT